MPRIHDPITLRKTITGMSMIVAPLLLLGMEAVEPETSDDIASSLRNVAAHDDRALTGNLLLLLAICFLLPAIGGLIHLVHDRGASLAHIGGGLALLGACAFSIDAFLGFVALTLSQNDTINQQQQTILMEQLQNNPGVIMVTITFLLGLFPGFLMLAGGLWRSGVVPRWSAVLLGAFALLDFLNPGGSIIPVIAGILLMIGLGSIGIQVLRMPTREWVQPSTSVADHEVLTPIPSSTRPETI